MIYSPPVIDRISFLTKGGQVNPDSMLGVKKSETTTPCNRGGGYVQGTKHSITLFFRAFA